VVIASSTRGFAAQEADTPARISLSAPPPKIRMKRVQWRIVFTRMGSDPATRAYVERRTAEGKSKAEIIRCLKRYVAREIYPHLRHSAG
jgi:hypothetical protein